MEKYYWLNEGSREFLNRDYLIPGTTPEQRIRDIAVHAGKILNIPGFADKFEDYMSRGWFSLSTPIWCNFGLDRGLSISCVTGDTWINTYDGGKMAKDIQLGDLVLTHKNRFKPVKSIMPTKNKGDIWKLKVGTRLTNLYITGNHPVLTNVGWVKVEDLDIKEHLVAVNGTLEYKSEEYTLDLKNFTDYKFIIKDGLIRKAIENKSEKSKKRNINTEYVTWYASPNEFIHITEELAWALGIWFAEGSLSTSNKKEPNGVRITVNDKDEAWVAEKWLDIMSNSFGVKGNIYTSIVERNGKKNSWISVNIHSKIVGNLFKSFGEGAKHKKIPSWLLSLPKNKLQSFLDGILLGDGHKGVSGNNTITLANPKLLLQVYNIGLKLGHDMSLQMQSKASKLASTSHVYTLNFRGYENSIRLHSVNAGIRFNDGLIYCPIKILEKTDKIEDVFDFEVEEDHSFSCAGIVVHNCFSIDIQDTISDILKGVAEIGTMAKYGGGTAGYFGNLRARGASVKNNGTSSGAVHFIEPYETIAQVINQGQARRGHFSAYLPITHPDIEEFLRIKEEGHPLQHISFGITIPDNWMEDMIAGDTAKRELIIKIHKSRSEKGMPYILYEGNVNKYKPKVYIDKGLHIKQSNMCTEIIEYTDEFKSFVCCISSMNLLHFDEWKDTDAVETMAYFLDAVYTDFINKAQHIPFMDKAVRFAKEHRSIGIGALGYHSYLQSKMIPFESMEAKLINSLMFKTINDRSLKASRELALLFGEPLILQGYGERFTTRVAIAPTTSSSFILGQVSPSIEPLMSNYFLKDLAKGVFTYRNPYLKQVLEAKGEDTEKTWKSIMMKGGSVQHLNFLSEHEKAVFKTFSEISQLEIIQQAAARQKFIDQAQSLNLMIPPDATIREINLLVIEAWKLGIKTLYYQRGANMAQQVGRSLLECVACE